MIVLWMYSQNGLFGQCIPFVIHISSYTSTSGSSFVTDCLAMLLLDLDFYFQVYVIGT